MLKKNLTRLALGAAAAALVPCAIAQSDALPAAQSANGIKYVEGGIGKDESTAMLKEAGRYPLSLVFSGGKSNQYLSEVRVTVKDSAGKTLLSEKADGPIMLIDLPAGKYVIGAEFRGKALTQGAEVAVKRATRLDFHWAQGD